MKAFENFAQPPWPLGAKRPPAERPSADRPPAAEAAEGQGASGAPERPAKKAKEGPGALDTPRATDGAGEGRPSIQPTSTLVILPKTSREVRLR